MGSFFRQKSTLFTNTLGALKSALFVRALRLYDVQTLGL